MNERLGIIKGRLVFSALLQILFLCVISIGAAADDENIQMATDLLKHLSDTHEHSAQTALNAMPESEREKKYLMAESMGIPIDKLVFNFSYRGYLRGISGIDVAIPTSMDSRMLSEDCALLFIEQYKDLFGIRSPREELTVRKKKMDSSGQNVVYFDQKIDGLPIFGNSLLVRLTQDNELSGLDGLLLPSAAYSFDATSVVLMEDAIQIAESNEIPFELTGDSSATLGVFDPEVFLDSQEDPSLAWKVVVHTEGPHEWAYFIDAADGSILLIYDEIRRDYPFEVYWTNNTTNMPGTLIYRNSPYYYYGSTPGTSYEIFLGAYWTRKYYMDRHDRDGYDDGQAIPAYHRQSTTSDYDQASPPNDANAFWHTGILRAGFGSNAACNDIVGHEITHGVDQFEANLNYSGQSGALCEAFSDFFGELIEKYSMGTADWMQGTPSPYTTCFPIRKLSDPENPPTCPPGYGGMCHYSSSHWNNYDASYESEFPHYNMGIGTKSGWLLGREPSQGAATFAGVTVTGIGEQKAGSVWYDVLCNRLSSSSKYTQFRTAIEQSAWTILNSSDAQQADRSVRAVGIWTGDVQEGGFDTDYPLSISNFTVSGQSRKYIFYREPVGTNPRLFYRYRTCPLYQGCGWTSASQLSYTAKGPTSVVFNNYLWVFYKYDLNNNIYIHRMDGSGNWNSFSWSPISTPTTDASPFAIVAYNKIFVFYKSVGSGTRRVYYVTWSTSNGWEGPFETPIFSTSGPVVADLYYGWLHVFYEYGSTGQNLRYRWYYLGTWSDEYYHGSTVGSPALAVFKNRLHVATRASDNSIYYTSYCDDGVGCTYRPDEWTLWVKQDGGARNFLTLIPDDGPYGGSLYMFLRGKTSNLLYWRSKDSE